MTVSVYFTGCIAAASSTKMQQPRTDGLTLVVAVGADTVADVSVMMPPPAALPLTRSVVQPSAAALSPLQVALDVICNGKPGMMTPVYGLEHQLLHVRCNACTIGAVTCTIAGGEMARGCP